MYTALRRSAIVGLIVTAVFGCIPASAAAYTTVPSYTATDFATGFATCCTEGLGPIGIATDAATNIYVADYADANVYKFGAAGGIASASTQLTSQPISGQPDALIFSPTGRLYATLQSAGEVIELDPSTGSILRIVATGIPCATGMAVDPISGDLFVSSSYCSFTVWRISNFESASPTATAYASGFTHPDGLTFGADGTLYVVDQESPTSSIVQVSGTNAQASGTKSELASVSNADGIIATSTGGSTPALRLVVNRTDGSVTLVDFPDGTPSYTDIMTGGSRGDFAAIDPNGCLYITQSDSVVKLTNSDGSCSFNAASPPPPPPPGGELAQPMLVSPPDGARLPVGDVTLTWQPVTGATGYELVLDNVQSHLDGTGTSATASGLSPGPHTWSILALPSRDDYSVTWGFTLGGSGGGGTPGDGSGYRGPPALSEADKVAEARYSLGHVLFGAFGCGLGFVGGASGISVVLALPSCGEGIVGIAGTSAAILDPPDRNYPVVFSPQPVSVPKAHLRCRRLPVVVCTRLKVATRRYLEAAARAESLTEAVGVTANRFGGARAAGDQKSADTQRVAEATYLALQATAMRRQRLAGRKLARELKRDHLDVVFSARQVARGRRRLVALRGVPHSYIARLRHEGLISSARDLQVKLRLAVKRAGPPRRITLSQLLAQ